MAPESALDASARVAGSDGRAPSRRTGLMVVTGLLLIAAVRLLALEPTSIASESMEPTLQRGDHVLVDKLSPRLGRDPQRGDLVTFTSPEDAKHTLKRVVGVAGDRVRIDDGVLIVNDRVVPEPYVNQASIDALYWGTITVPAEHIVVLGDRRARSIDSRTYGPVPITAMDGRVLVRLWPPGR